MPVVEAVQHERGPGQPSASTRRWRNVVLGLSIAAVSAAIVGGTVTAFSWMETPEFCGACHTMKPELQAYDRSPHRKVDCAECHIGAGFGDLIRAKLDGTRQLVEVINGTYDRPIPPAGHKMSRGAVSETCTRCHAEAPSQQDRLLVRHRFLEDETNTERDVALVLKVAKPLQAGSKGIHWHVSSDVEFLPTDERMREVSYVRVTDSDGTVSEYASGVLAARLTASPGLADDTLAPVRTSPDLVRMTCITCHNRVGHELLSPDRAVDDALAVGRLDVSLPFVKREATRLLTQTYSSSADADAAIDDQLPNFYRSNYPLFYEARADSIRAASAELKDLFTLIGSPEMGATYRDYPTFLGHRDTNGCFRCHGGNLAKLDHLGRPSGQTVPSACSTCHTPPQLTDTVAMQSILGVPATQHGADMRFSHAAAIRAQGGPETCALCHQQPFCSRCHTEDINVR